jgi:hypothetical protein
MKWLILMTLLSCGKHEAPTYLDLRDSDGDQVQNFQEYGMDKYIADIRSFGVVEGTLKYSDVNLRETSFTNRNDLKSEIMKLAVGDTSTNHEKHFSEWSILKLDLSNKLSETSSEVNTVHLHFTNVEIEPDELLLLKGNSRIKLGRWAAYMRVELSKDQFNELMKGKSSLWLKKNVPKKIAHSPNSINETVVQKTSRLYINDGTDARVLYISKDLDSETLLNHFDITSSTLITDELLFFNSHIQTAPKWFHRDYENGDKVVVYGTLDNLRSYFYNKFEKSTLNLMRENGHPINSLVISNPSKAPVYLRVRPSQVMRTFKEHSESKTHRVGSALHGSDDSWNCNYLKRAIQSEYSILPRVEEFMQYLNMNLNDVEIIEQRDERGIFWEVKLLNILDNANFSLPTKSPDSFTTTGQYSVKCDRGMPAHANSAAYSTNVEGKLSFEIESFVEKIK